MGLLVLWCSWCLSDSWCCCAVGQHGATGAVGACGTACALGACGTAGGNGVVGTCVTVVQYVYVGLLVLWCSRYTMGLLGAVGTAGALCA